MNYETLILNVFYADLGQESIQRINTAMEPERYAWTTLTVLVLRRHCMIASLVLMFSTTPRLIIMRPSNA